MNTLHTALDVQAEVAKAAPPVFISGLSIFGYPIGDFVAVVTLVYLVLQIYCLIRKIGATRGNRGS